MKQQAVTPSPLKAMQQNIHQHHWEEAVNRASGRESELVRRWWGRHRLRAMMGCEDSLQPGSVQIPHFVLL
jgi:hypothetical protein